MKRIFGLILAVVLFSPFAVYAASIEGALTQGKGKFAAALDGEYVFERDVKRQPFTAAFVLGLIGNWSMVVKLKKFSRVKLI